MTALPPTRAPTPLEGLWQMIRAELAGERAPDELVESTTFELSHGNYTVRFAGGVVDHGTFAEMVNATPPSIVLHGLNGPNAGRTIPCIFQIRGERLRVCYGLNAVTPTDFTTCAADGRYLALYRRAGLQPPPAESSG